MKLALNNFYPNQIGEDKSLNEDGFRSWVSNELAIEDYQKAIANRTSTKCINFLKKILYIYEDKFNGTSCSWITPIAVSCVWMKFSWSCPTGLQNPSEKCAQNRQVYALLQDMEKYANLEDCCKVENAAKQIAIIKERFSLANKCAKELGMFIILFE